MRWRHAYAVYDVRPKDGDGRARPKGKEVEKERLVKWWDTKEGDRETTLEKPEEFFRTVLDLASRDGWGFAAKDTYTFIFKKPAD